MQQLPRAARPYLLACYVLGLGAGAWLILSDARMPGLHAWLAAAGWAGLAAAAQAFVVQRAHKNHGDAMTSAPLFAAFLLLPEPLLALVICLAFVPEWVIYRRKVPIQVFNVASWLMAAAAGKWALLLVAGRTRMHEIAEPLPALAIVLAMLAFLGVQTLLLAWVLKLARGYTFGESGLFAPQKLVAEAALLCSGWAFATAWLVNPLYGFASVVPLVLIFQALHVPNLKEEASTDAKTGLANMRHFNALLSRDLERAARSGQPLSLLMCDLDLLRDINNTHGHQTGDLVLAGAADVIRRTIRACDLAARFGGEEFVVLLADTDGVGAQQVAERIRAGLERTPFRSVSGDPVGATVSVGVATYPGDGRLPETLMREADLAVYQAKRDGRNRVVVAGRASRELAGEWAREHLVLEPAFHATGGLVPRVWRFLSHTTRLPAGVEPAQNGAAPFPAMGASRSTNGSAGNQVAARPPLEQRVALFVGAVCTAGFLSIVPGLTELVEEETALPGTSGDPLLAALAALPWAALVLFAALTVLLERLAVDVGDKRGKVSVSDVAVLGAGFLYGDAGCIVTAAAFALSVQARARSQLHRMFFNFGNALLSAQGATWAFRRLVDQGVEGTPFHQMLAPAVLAGLVYYAINHALLVLARGLSERRSPWRIWRTQYQWLWPHSAVLGALALMVGLGYLTFGWTGLVAMMAPVAMMHVAYQQYVERTAGHLAELQRMNKRLGDSYEATLMALTRALDTRDEETEEHSQRVRRYAELIARRLGLPEDAVQDVSRGALLHDIGKIGVPDAVLLKPGPLTADERTLMSKHPTIGYSMIAHIPFLTSASEVVLHHHESFDGTGYPSKLAGERIPLGARIFAVADAFDAMTSDRPYRKAMPPSVALVEIERCSGTQFDPRVAEALLNVPLPELLASRRGFTTPAQQRDALFGGAPPPPARDVAIAPMLPVLQPVH